MARGGSSPLRRMRGIPFRRGFVARRESRKAAGATEHVTNPHQRIPLGGRGNRFRTPQLHDATTSKATTSGRSSTDYVLQPAREPATDNESWPAFESTAAELETRLNFCWRRSRSPPKSQEVIEHA